MSEPSLALQAAVVTALKGSAAVGAICGDKIYDRVPETAQMPYVTITGDEQIIDDGNSCGDAWEVFWSAHVWSDAVGMPQAKQLGAAVRDALLDITLDGFTVVEATHRDSRYIKDPNPLVTHGIITMRYLIDPA